VSRDTALHVHGEEPIFRAGPASGAKAGLVLIHGRGGSARDISTISRHLPVEGFAVRAPQAAAGTWYPRTFLAPLEDNEPGLSSGLRRIAEVLDELRRLGLPDHRVVLLGFSQGACLTLEYAARHPARYGGVVGLTGGLIGRPGTPRDYTGSLAGTPVFLGAGDPDPHVPWTRVLETAQVLEGMGAVVEARRYPGMGHTVNAEELRSVARLLTDLVGEAGE